MIHATTRRSTVLALVLLLAAGSLWAAGSGTESDSDKTQDLYEKGVAAAEAGRYEQARDHFQDVVDEEPKNAEAWNMLAYSQRNLGLYDEAFTNYAKALELRPEFAEAREYLAEAHLQAALEQLEVLRSYGDADDEVAQLVAAFEKAADDAKSGASGGGGTPPGERW